MTPADDERRRADLSAYLDGELDPPRAAEIERWLAESASARSLLAGLRAVSEGVRELPRAAAPPGLAANVLAAAAAGASRSSLQVLLLRAVRAAMRVSAAAALIAIGVFVGWWTATPPVSSLPPRPGVALRSPPSGAEAEPAVPDARHDDSLRRLQTLGYVGDAEKKTGSRDVLKGPVAELGERADESFALRPPLPGESSQVSSTPIENAATGIAGGQAAGLPLSTSAEIAAGSPTVTVTVEPRSRQEYDAAVAAIKTVQRAQIGAVKLGRGRQLSDKLARMYGGAQDRPGDESAPIPIVQAGVAPPLQSSAFHLPQAALPPLLAKLEQQSPERVQVAAHYRQSDAAALQALFTPQPSLPAPPAPATAAWVLPRAAGAPPAGESAPRSGVEDARTTRPGAPAGEESTQQAEAAESQAAKTHAAPARSGGRPSGAAARGRGVGGEERDAAREAQEVEGGGRNAVGEPGATGADVSSSRPAEPPYQESLGYNSAFGLDAAPVFVQFIILPPRADAPESQASTQPMMP